MSKTERRFLHVRMRARARYGIELPRHVWDAWNRTFKERPVLQTFPDGGTVRELVFHGTTFRALCGDRHVLTVLPREAVCW